MKILHEEVKDEMINIRSLQDIIDKWGRNLCFKHDCGYNGFSDNAIDWMVDFLIEQYGEDVVPTNDDMERALLNYLFYMEDR